MVVLATLATVIASQAVISGAFSVTRQAVQLGFLPRLTIRHTSEHEVGQVYVPVVNWVLFVAVVALVVGFGSSQALASAYGIAVTGTLAIDTILFFVVVRTLLAQAAVDRAARAPRRSSSSTSRSSPRTCPRSLHGGWFPLTDRRARVHRADDLAAGPRDRHRQPHRGGGPAAATSSTSSTTQRPAGPPRARHRGLPQRQHATRRRWRCGRTSSTTTCCTRAS